MNNQENSLVLIKDLGMINPTEKSTYKVRYGLYKCYCGNEFESPVNNVKRGHTKSCGCYKKQRTIESKTTHKLTKHRLYGTWNQIMQRCNNPKHKAYKNYGGRGITVCDEWLDVKNFIDDMYSSYRECLTIDRIDVDGNYCKDNCRWVDSTIQNRNTRKTRTNNTSGYRGVSFFKRDDKWRAQICVNNKTKHIGYFDTPLEAAQTYDNYVIINGLEHTLNFKGN